MLCCCFIKHLFTVLGDLMKRMLLTISYDGTAYHGWQVQPNGITVQQTLQEALEKLLGKKTSVTGCSRTDAGVHAREFACHIDCDDNFPKDAFLGGLNSLLPNDISIIDCCEVEKDFHARYNAKGKTYIYSMYYGVMNPFDARYKLHIEKIPNIALMNEFCSGIIGTHDFAGFSSSKRTVEDTVRTITCCEVITRDNYIFFKITGNGFLYNMVRILAGTALAVGYERLSPQCYNDVFKSKNRALGGDTLPPYALCLEKVYF